MNNLFTVSLLEITNTNVTTKTISQSNNCKILFHNQIITVNAHVKPQPVNPEPENSELLDFMQ